MSTKRRSRAALLVGAVIVASGGLVATPASAGSAVACNPTSTQYRYVVLFSPGTPADAVSKEITEKCGTSENYYAEIGVAVASSKDSAFERNFGLDRAYSAKKARTALVAAVGAEASRRPVVDEVVTKGALADLSAQSWDMRAIKADQANKINEGSRTVVVGVLDTGVDGKHPDLVKAVDKSLSAGCDTGTPNPAESAWSPNNPHGTHVAGTIAAANNKDGITGIAPGVRIASVRVTDSDGMIYPEYAVCGFMWAAAKGFTVTNNSYFMDPFMFWCKDKPGEKVGHEAARRAIGYAHGKNVLTVAAAGNSSLDLANTTTDPGQAHPVNENCDEIPAELPEVVGASAIGYSKRLSSYSNYGKGVIDVTAPGGDSGQRPPSGQGPSCPLSTLPGGGYGSMCGTSMASPHVAGVAALVASKHPNSTPAQLQALLGAQADPLACPTGQPRCSGPAANNSYFGRGVVNALKAVS